MKHLLTTVIISTALPFNFLYAANPPVKETSPLIQPRITAEGLTGDHTVGIIDTLIPAPIHQQLANNELLFVDGRGRVSSDNSEEINLGLGYRRIFGNQSYILGAYAFYDGMESAHDNYLQEITAGMERLGHRWDGRINYYQPIGKKKFEISQTYSNPTIANHFVTVTNEEKFEEAIPGYDMELGALLTGHLHHGLKGFVGYYHFGWGNDAKTDGERVRFEQELTPNSKLVTFVQYDNQRHWQSYVGIRLSFGGNKHSVGRSSPLNRPINERLTDFIIRDLNVVTTNANETAPYRSPDRLLFVDNTVESSGDGTYKAPLASLDDALSIAKSSDLIFIKRGTGNYDIGNATLHPNQRITSSHYDIKLPNRKEPLSFLNEERPTLTGRLDVVHGNQLQNLIVDANNSQSYGIYGNGANSVQLVNLDVMNATNKGIRLDNVTDAQIINTQIHDNAKEGLYLLNNHNTLLKHIQVNNNLRDGIYAKNSTQMTISDSSSKDNNLTGISIQQSTGTSYHNQWINNIREGFLSRQSTFNFNNDTLKNNSVGTTKYSQAYGNTDSTLTFRGLKQLDGKFKATSGSTLIMHTGEDTMKIIDGAITLNVEH
ncbi:MAG: right-handed parallel beta-helix repeat-containing protein [Gammaproteobacteria bacterium]